VQRKGAASFEVCELAGGKSNVTFVGRRKDIRTHPRFAKIDTRLELPAGATRPPRKRAPGAAALRAFLARLEKDARERAPKGAMRARRSGAFPRLTRPSIRTQQISKAKKK